MRSILLSIMFCLISSISWSDNVTWADLVKNPSDGLVYKKFTTTPFSGTVAASATHPVQRTYKDGVAEGIWISFNDNGLVSGKNTMSNGKLVFTQGYHKNGRLSYRGPYDPAVGNVDWFEQYYENGQLREKRQLNKDAYRHGLSHGYYEDGQVAFIEEYVDGNRYKDGKPLSGIVKYFYSKDGQLKNNIEYSEGELVVIKRYYKNGQLHFNNNYKDGKRHGLWESFTEDGSLLFSDKYENGVKVSD